MKNSIEINLVNQKGKPLGGLTYLDSLTSDERNRAIRVFFAQKYVWDHITGCLDKDLGTAPIVGIQIIYKGKDWSTAFPTKRFKAATIVETLVEIAKMFHIVSKSAEKLELMPLYTGLPLEVPYNIRLALSVAKQKAEEAKEAKEAKEAAMFNALTETQKAGIVAKEAATKAAKAMDRQAKKTTDEALRMAEARELVGLN